MSLVPVPIGWTRRAAVGLAAAGLVVPAIVVFDLFTDHTCNRAATPHPLQAAILATLAILTACGGVLAHDRAARWVAPRVSVGSKLQTLLPVTMLGIANAALAFWFYYAYALHVCVGIDWLLPH